MTPYGFSEEILQDIVAVAARHPALKTITLYGSRAKGNFKNYSDIDLAFTVGETNDPYAASKIAFELRELPIVFKIDVVNLDELTNENLKQKIAEEGVVLFAR